MKVFGCFTNIGTILRSVVRPNHSDVVKIAKNGSLEGIKRDHFGSFFSGFCALPPGGITYRFLNDFMMVGALADARWLAGLGRVNERPL